MKLADRYPAAWIGGFRLHPTYTNKSAFAWTDGSKFNYMARDRENFLGRDDLCLLFNEWNYWNIDTCGDKRVHGFICQTNSLKKP